MVEEIQNPNSVPAGVTSFLLQIFLFLKIFSQLGETVSRPGTGAGLSRPVTGKIWTVEGDEALGNQTEDLQSMSPTGLTLI